MFGSVKNLFNCNRWPHIQGAAIAMIKAVQGRHGEFEPGKAQYSTPNFFDRFFLYEHIETQNLGKAQAFGALPSVAPLLYFEIRSSVAW